MAAIVVSLVFVGLQLRQSEEAAMSDLSQSTVAVGIEIGALMAENSGNVLRPPVETATQSGRSRSVG